MSKTYTITVDDAKEIKSIDEAIALRKGDASKVLYRGAYDVIHRTAYMSKRNEMIKEYTKFKKNGGKIS